MHLLIDFIQLYNLKKEGLLNKKEVQPQQKEAEDAIKSIQDSLEEYIKNYDLVRINKEISETQKHIENIYYLRNYKCSKIIRKSIPINTYIVPRDKSC